MPAGTVEVFLIGAVGIKDTEIFGKADPYAVLFCGKQRLRSNTASNQGSKPVWNQKFSFYIDDSATELQIRVYNHNILTEDDELGHTIIPLSKVFAENKLPTTSYNVVRPSGRVQGEVKLSITFSPKNKLAQQPSQSVSGPYNAKVHGSPYTPPAPFVKHDPLLGPNGYYRSGSSTSHSDSSHGGNSLSHSSKLDGGGSRRNPEMAMDAYPPSVYRPITSMNESQCPHHHMDTSTSYLQAENQAGASHQQPYPSMPFNYDADIYKHAQYGHGPPTSAPNLHGVNAPPSASSLYPPVSSVPSMKQSHGGHNQGNRLDELAENFSGLNVYGNPGEYSSGGYQGYYRPSEKLTSGYSATESSSRGHYPGYKPPQNTSSVPNSGYPPVTNPMAGYPPHFSGHQSSHQAGYYASHVGDQSYGRVDPGIPQDGPPNPYPPVPYYSSPSAHYVPAGYPK